MNHAVIMAGGSGTRFWPESRKALPKQFLNFSGEETLIQAAFQRCQPWISTHQTWVITNQRYQNQTTEQLTGILSDKVLLEPQGRNTAPCIAWAASEIVKDDPQGIMIVMSADHIINSREQFQQCAQQAVNLIEHKPEELVLFGIKPTYPSTGFGYIQRGNLHNNHPGVFQVKSFREKPDLPTAQEYLTSGEYYWNSGIFVWKASTILSLIKQFQPRILEQLELLEEKKISLQQAFTQMPSISIDYAVLEHAGSVSVLEATFAWDDVGSWQALSRMIPADRNGNVALGKTCLHQTTNSIIRSQGDHLIATMGVDHLIVVHTPTATLIGERGDENSIRELIKKIETEFGDHYL